MCIQFLNDVIFNAFEIGGNRDWELANELANEIGITEKEVADKFKEWILTNGSADPVGIIYDLALEQTAKELNHYGIDEDLFYKNIQVASNYLATEYDFTDESIEEIQNELNKVDIDIEDLPAVVKWTLDKLNLEV